MIKLNNNQGEYFYCALQADAFFSNIYLNPHKNIFVYHIKIYLQKEKTLLIKKRFFVLFMG